MFKWIRLFIPTLCVFIGTLLMCLSVTYLNRAARLEAYRCPISGAEETIPNDQKPITYCTRCWFRVWECKCSEGPQTPPDRSAGTIAWCASTSPMLESREAASTLQIGDSGTPYQWGVNLRIATAEVTTCTRCARKLMTAPERLPNGQLVPTIYYTGAISLHNDRGKELFTGCYWCLEETVLMGAKK